MFLFLEYCSGGELFDRIGETFDQIFQPNLKKHMFILWYGVVDISRRLLNAYDVFFLLFLEPDVGMPEKNAHRFFLQLISAVVGEAYLCDEESLLPISLIT